MCRTTVALAAVTALASMSAADTISLSFSNITNNGNDDLSGQLRVDVCEVAGDATKVDFQFTNDVGIASSISEIYFDNGSPSSLFASGSIITQIGTEFEWGSASPGDLPGGNQPEVDFTVSPGFLADAQGNPSKGVDAATDLLVVRLMFNDGMTFGDLSDALGDGSLRLGMHIRAIDPRGGSDSYVNDPIGPVIPLPGAASLAIAGCGLIGLRRRR